MRLLLLPFFPLWVFAVFLAGKAFMMFAADNGHRWWGGFPLWMAGACGVISPVLLGGLVGIAFLIWP